MPLIKKIFQLNKNEEIIWSRVIIFAMVSLLGALLILLLGLLAITSLFIHPPAPAAAAPVPVKVMPTNLSRTIPAWPEEVLQQVPAGIVTIPTLDPSPPVLIPTFNESMPGIRNVSQFFTIHRDNVSGLKNLEIKTTVYGWQELHQVKWYSDSDGKYLDQFTPSRYENYLFVYLVSYVNGNTTKDDPRPWYFGPQVFRLQVEDRMYDQDTEFMPNVRLKEMEEVPGYNQIRGLRPYGYTIVQDQKIGNITAQPDPYMKLGASNAKDGYLVFRIPAGKDASTMMLVGSFGSWGTAAWRLA